MRWQCVTLGFHRDPVSSLIKNLNNVLDTFVIDAMGTTMSEADVVVLIERQPPFARSVSHVVMGATAMWAENCGLVWHLVTPVQRGGTYRERKAAAVKSAREELVAAKDTTFLPWFNAIKKKDDAADAYHLARVPSPKTSSEQSKVPSSSAKAAE